MSNDLDAARRENIPPKQAADRHFRTDHLRGEVKERSVRSAAITVANQTFLFVLRLGTTVVMARLLTPDDYGLVGMVTGLLAFLAVFNDVGLAQATVQKAEVTHQEASTLFWIGAGVSSSLTLVAAVAAPAIAWFYGDARLVAVSLALAFGFFLQGMSFPQSAVLKRQLRFGTLAAIELAGSVIAAALGMALAWSGASYWSLVAMQLGGAAVQMSGLWLATRWRPGRPGRLVDVAPQLRFGAGFLGYHVVGSFVRSLDRVLLGWRFGAPPVGLYTRAFHVSLLPMQQLSLPIGNVAMAALARVQDDRERFRRYFCRAMAAIAALGIPMAVAVACLSGEIVRIVLGPQWLEAGPLVAILTLGGAVHTLTACTGWILVATGRTDRLMGWALLSAPLVVLSFVLGLPWGPWGIAVGYCAGQCVLAVPWCYFSLWRTPVTVGDLVGSIWRSAVLGVALFLAMSATHAWGADWGMLARVLACCLSGGATYAAALAVWPGLRRDQGLVLDIVRLLLGGAGISFKPAVPGVPAEQAASS